MLELISLIDEIRAQYSSYLSYGVNVKNTIECLYYM